MLVQWTLEDLTDIREVAIIRKRYTSIYDTDSPQPFQNAAEVFVAADRDGDGIPEGDINIIGLVNATDTSFEDVTYIKTLMLKIHVLIRRIRVIITPLFR